MRSPSAFLNQRGTGSMNPAYKRIRAAARDIAAGLPTPAFYRTFQRQYAQSRQFFETDAVIRRLYHHAMDSLSHAMGHGGGHATAVSVDAGCLVLVEIAITPQPVTALLLLRLVQAAGLLHDICRGERDHAAAGATAAEALLADYPFTHEEIQGLCNAIRGHVAFQAPPPPGDPITELIGNCLYDADKFRWGPDNFTHTVWDMLDAAAISPGAFAKRYDSGIQYVETVSTTFRTATGRRYGPEFIDQGLIIARQLKPFIDAEVDPRRAVMKPPMG